MTREEVIRAVAQVLASLQVVAVIGVPLGTAGEVWSKLHDALIGSGWSDAFGYEAALFRFLDESED